MTLQPQPPAERGRENEKYGGFLGHLPHGQLLTALAVPQHGVFDLRQVAELGISARAAQARVGVGALHRVHHTVYSLVPPALLTREGRWTAAVLAAGPGAVLSHRCAAALHGLRAYNGTKLDVTIPIRSGRAHPGITIHRSTTLTEADVTVVDGIPCTTVARTLLDLADVTRRRPLERAFDQAEVLEVFDLIAVQDQLSRAGRRRAAKIVRALLNEHYVGSTVTWSELEEAFLALCRRFGLPRFEVNEFIVLPDGGPAIRADFLFRAERVVVEVDSIKYHLTTQAFERDRDRDQRLSMHRYWPFRTTSRQILRTPTVTGRRLLRLIELARATLRSAA